VKDGARFKLNFDMPKSVGRVRSFFGNVGILFRGYCYIRTLGPDGLKQVSEQAVLNANYLRARVIEGFDVPHAGPCMHEFVASARMKELRDRKIKAVDICKRLLDYGFHAPTVYFPMVVAEALMMEPTETESKETLDAFADTLLKIKAEDADVVKTAPHTHVVSRPDEVKAAKELKLRWTPTAEKGTPLPAGREATTGNPTGMP
jgi:glycine dehydrogenase subunit 2